ncbi:unnamed protein product [Schistosoma curassoni]|uniref:Uncharacterized protein n=1 Tax=Schistosoma curassoni TaxID=6186 RepID=A0A3P8HBX7_9TREM|nr:unnamed protein product [Schistosoma curassoni]
MVGCSQQETLDLGFVPLGTRQQDVPVILRELILPDGFDPMSPSFTVRNVNTGLSGLRLISYRTEMYSQLIDQCHVCQAAQDRIRQKTSVPSRLQVQLANKYQVARNLNPGFPVD